MTIAFLSDGIAAAIVTRVAEGKPVLTLSAFHATTEPTAAAALEKFGKELAATDHQFTTLLGNGEYQLLNVDAPNVLPEELKTAVRFRLQDMLDFHVDDATIDVLDIPIDKAGASRTHTMFVVAARNSVIAQRQALFEAAKLKLKVIDIPEMAQRNISALAEVPGRGLAMLSFHAGGGLLSVTFNGELYLARRIDVTLTQLLDPDIERRNACFDKITLELQRSLDHFERQFNFIAVQRLLLAPTGASALHDYLSANLYMPVEDLDLASLVDLGSSAAELATAAAQQRFFYTIGAALRVEETVL
jgi:MSHA biogenesis protein MshI